jgi:hypothetical protein
MTDVEHYALSLVYFTLIGFIVGVAKETLEEYKRGRRTSLDLLYIWGFFFAIGYGFVGFKFVDGRYFIWFIPLFLAGVGSRLGRVISTSRKDLSMGAPILTAYFAVPLLFHCVL